MSFLHVTGAVVNTHNGWLPMHFSYWRVGKIAYQCKGRREFSPVLTYWYQLVQRGSSKVKRWSSWRHAPSHAPSPSLTFQSSFVVAISHRFSWIPVRKRFFPVIWCVYRPCASCLPVFTILDSPNARWQQVSSRIARSESFGSTVLTKSS